MSITSTRGPVGKQRLLSKTDNVLQRIVNNTYVEDGINTECIVLLTALNWC